MTEINGTYNPPYITNVTEDNNISSAYPVPTLNINEYGNNYNYIEQGKLSNGNQNILYAPIETVTNEQKLSNSNLTFGTAPSNIIDANQINQFKCPTWPNTHSNRKTAFGAGSKD